MSLLTIDRINTSQGADIASASTIDLAAATGQYSQVTGATTITAIASAAAGITRKVTFTGALTLTYNATSLILPGAANIITVAGDTAEFVSLGSGNWKCFNYTRLSSMPGLLLGGNTWSGNQNFGSGTLTTTGAVGTGALTISSGAASSAFSTVLNTGKTPFTIQVETAVWQMGGNAGVGPGDDDFAIYSNTWGSGHGSKPVFWLKSTGIVQMANYGAGAATFDASGNISSVSDERLKNIKGKYKSGLKELIGVEPILYKWNKKSGMETKGTYAGFSAQNVKKNIPYGTGKNNEGYLSLQDRAILAALVNSVKELALENKKLSREIKALKSKRSK